LLTGRDTLGSISVGSRDDFEAMNQAIAMHELHPVIDRTIPFAEAKAAYRHFEGREHFGQIVISHVERIFTGDGVKAPVSKFDGCCCALPRLLRNALFRGRLLAEARPFIPTRLDTSRFIWVQTLVQFDRATGPGQQVQPRRCAVGTIAGFAILSRVVHRGAARRSNSPVSNSVVCRLEPRASAESAGLRGSCRPAQSTL